MLESEHLARSWRRSMRMAAHMNTSNVYSFIWARLVDRESPPGKWHKQVFFIGRFCEAGLLEWMCFVIFRTRSRERSQPIPGQFPNRYWFTLCIAVEVEPRIAKQYKCQYCCSCKNYHGKGMEGGKKVSALFFGCPEDHEFVEMCFGASYRTSNKLLLISRHIMITGLKKCL